MEKRGKEHPWLAGHSCLFLHILYNNLFVYKSGVPLTRAKWGEKGRGTRK